jgi:hypothetical protein
MMKRISELFYSKKQVDEKELIRYHLLGKFSMKKLNEKLIDLSDEAKIILEINNAENLQYTLKVQNEDNIGK